MIRRADERASDFLSSRLATRLAKTIVRLSEKTKKLSLSQQELAEMTGAVRESINRQLTTWEDEGLIKRSQGWIVVVEREALEARSKPAN